MNVPRPALVGVAALIVLSLVVYVAASLGGRQGRVVAPLANDAVYGALAVAGIENALVDVTVGRTVVDYLLPADLDEDVALFYVLGAAARYTGPGAKISATAFRKDGKVVEEATAGVDDLLAFLREEIGLEECQRRVTRTKPVSRGSRSGGTAGLASPLRPGPTLQTEPTDDPAELARCWRTYQRTLAGCRSAEFRAAVAPERYEELKRICETQAKALLLRCIGIGDDRFVDPGVIVLNPKVIEETFDKWEEHVRTRGGSSLAPAIGAGGDAINRLTPGPGVVGGPGTQAGGKLIEELGRRAKDAATSPLSEDEEKKRKAQEEALKGREARSPDGAALLALPPRVHFVELRPSDATPESTGSQPHLTFMRAYRPERLSDTAQPYFPITPLADAAMYLRLRSFAGPDRDVMGIGFRQAGLFAEDSTRSYETWDQLLARYQAQATSTPTPGTTIAPVLSPPASEPVATVTPTPTQTPAPTPTPTPAPTPVPQVALSGDHLEAGWARSELYFDVLAAPGVTVAVTVTGPGLVGSPSQTGTTNASGELRLTWRITKAGPYRVAGTVGGVSVSAEVGILEPPLPATPTPTPTPAPTAKLTFEHTQPGVQSEVYLTLTGAPGAAVSATLAGPAVKSAATQNGTTDAAGELRLTWVITQFGTYRATGTLGGAAISAQVEVR